MSHRNTARTARRAAWRRSQSGTSGGSVELVPHLMEPALVGHEQRVDTNSRRPVIQQRTLVSKGFINLPNEHKGILQLQIIIKMATEVKP
jgi:hypothetical protein